MAGLTPQQAERQILVLLAGPPAERLVNPDAKQSRWRPTLSEAEILAYEIIGMPSAYSSRLIHRSWKQAIHAYLEMMQQVSEEMVQQHRAAVRLLAKRLQKAGHVSGPHCREILEEAIPHSPRSPVIHRGASPYPPPLLGQTGVTEPRLQIRHAETGELLLQLTEEQLVDTDLEGLILQGANLAGVVLRGKPNLSNVDLRKAILRGASLAYAQMERVNLRGADLRGACLYAASLVDANVCEANLEGSFLDYADLTGSSITGAFAAGASFWGANLTDVDLGRTNLAGATLAKAQLEGALLVEADLRGADLFGANLHGAELSREPADDGRVPLAHLHGALYDKETIWPEGVDPEQHRARLVTHIPYDPARHAVRHPRIPPFPT